MIDMDDLRYANLACQRPPENPTLGKLYNTFLEVLDQEIPAFLNDSVSFLL